MNHKKILFLPFIFSVFMAGCSSTGVSKIEATAEEELAFKEKVSVKYETIDISDFADGFNHARYQYENSIPPWALYDTAQILGFAENMIYTQNPDGGWAKNLDLQRVYTLSELLQIQNTNKSVPPVTYEKKTSSDGSTIDNGNIFSQIRYLAQVYRQVPDKRYLECMKKAVQWILNAQHPVSGGFTGADVYAVTYNDDVMSDTLRILNEISTDDSLYSILPSSIRKKASDACNRGIECILKTQIELTLKDGTKILTAWCQQHDHYSLKPVWAREFEPPSVCTSESRKVTEFLMEIEEPSEDVKKAVLAAGTWLSSDAIIIKGKERVKKSHTPVTLNGRYYDYEYVLEDNENASPLWARFYALDSSYDVVSGARKQISGNYPEVNTPVFCDRGCKYVEDYNDLSMERRNGYSYVGTWPKNFIPKFERWKAKYGL